jgi:membrane protein DedA with SNARE-associated domain
MSSLLLSSGSLILIVGWILVGGIGVPVPEDPAVLGAGALIYHGTFPAVLVLPIVVVSVVAGDFALFSIARKLGPRALERPLFQELLPEHRRAWIEDAFARHGGKLVFFARHVAGLRAATFALAGINGMPARKFLAWDAIGACISVPIMVGLGYGFALHIDRVRRGIATAEHWGVLVLIVVTLVYLAVRAYRDHTESVHAGDGHDVRVHGVGR